MITVAAKITDAKAVEYLRHYNINFQQNLRRLYSALYRQNMQRADAKRYFILKYGISAREFNSLYNQLDAQLKSVNELTKIQIDDIKHSLAKIEKSIKTKTKGIEKNRSLIKSIDTYRTKARSWKESRKGKKPKPLKRIRGVDAKTLQKEIDSHQAWIKQKQLRCLSLGRKLAQREKELEDPSICFGSRKLFKAQFRLKENGFKSHQEWRKAWRWNRGRTSFFVGSKDEKAGNQNAQYNDNYIRLRVPRSLRHQYGEVIKVAVLFTQPEFHLARAKGQAISYRFVEKQNLSRRGKPLPGKTMYAMASFEPKEEPVSLGEGGTIGVDLNADHIACCAIDPKGNPIGARTFGFNFRQKSSHQIAAILGDHVAEIVRWAQSLDMSISIERLDFRAKKKALRERYPKRMRRLLSQFAYKKFHDLMMGKCRKEHVRVQKVNPAWTSLIGKIKFSGYSHRLTTHQMASLAIGRRAQGFSERPKRRSSFTSPDWMKECLGDSTLDDWTKSHRIRHVWSFWSRHKKALGQKTIDCRIPKKWWASQWEYSSRHPSGLSAQGGALDSAFLVKHFGMDGKRNRSFSSCAHHSLAGCSRDGRPRSFV